MLTRKFGRKKAHRTHMLRNLAASVILFETVQTTEAKGKEIKRLVDHSITIAKKNTLAARRQLDSLYFDPNVAKKLVEVLAGRYADRPSGYTRLFKTGNRVGDNADRVMISLIAETTKPAEEPKKSVKAKKDEVTVDAEKTQESNDAKAE